jgi:hypothetical protein
LRRVPGRRCSHPSYAFSVAATNASNASQA